MTSKQIRDSAAQALKGRMPLAVAASLLIGMLCALGYILLDSVLFLCGLVDYDTGEFILTDLALKNAMLIVICAVLLLLWVVIVMPIKVGVARWFFGFANGGEPPLSEVFYAFSREHYVRTLDYCVRLFLKKTLWTLPCVLPGILMSGLGILASQNGIYAAEELYAVGIVVFCMGFIGSRFICLRYFAANYVFASSDDVSGKEAIGHSVRIMRGKKAELETLVFSHIGWFLLTIPTIGLSLVYVVPRYHAALGIFAKQSIDRYLYSLREYNA